MEAAAVLQLKQQLDQTVGSGVEQLGEVCAECRVLGVAVWPCSSIRGGEALLVPDQIELVLQLVCLALEVVSLLDQGVVFAVFNHVLACFQVGVLVPGHQTRQA